MVPIIAESEKARQNLLLYVEWEKVRKEAQKVAGQLLPALRILLVLGLAAS